MDPFVTPITLDAGTAIAIALTLLGIGASGTYVFCQVIIGGLQTERDYFKTEASNLKGQLSDQKAESTSKNKASNSGEKYLQCLACGDTHLTNTSKKKNEFDTYDYTYKCDDCGDERTIDERDLDKYKRTTKARPGMIVNSGGPRKWMGN